MKKNLLLLLVIAFAGTMVACDPNDEPAKDGLLSLSTESLEFVAAGETKTVDITGKNWTATESAAWIGVTETEGKITVVVGKNETTDPRSGSIIIANNEDSKTVSVTQLAGEEPVDPTLTIDPMQVDFPVEGGTETVTITSELEWEAIPTLEWITVEPAEGGISITVGACPLAGGRSGVITVDNGNQVEMKYITVRQEGTGAALSTFTDDVAIGEITLGHLSHSPNQFDGLADAYTTQSMSAGVTVGARGQITGTGYIISSQFNTTLESGGVIPNGEYQIARNDAPWHVLGGFTPNGNVLVGMWVRRLDNNVEVQRGPVVYGTVTVSRTGDIYTIEIDGLDDAGHAVTATLTGTGAFS